VGLAKPSENLRWYEAQYGDTDISRWKLWFWSIFFLKSSKIPEKEGHSPYKSIEISIIDLPHSTYHTGTIKYSNVSFNNTTKTVFKDVGWEKREGKIEFWMDREADISGLR
jgi:phosphoribosylaminoimidazole-succinocarboxamide synthase